MSFSRWLRNNSEHYLMIAAQERVAREHGVPGPRGPRGIVELFWLRVFAPVYRLLPWPVRHRIMRQMPGSHRRTWAPPPTRNADLPPFPRGTSIQQQKESGHGKHRG